MLRTCVLISISAALSTAFACASPRPSANGNALPPSTFSSPPAFAPTPAPEPPGFPPTPAPAYGIYDEYPSLSADGRKIVWFHRAGYETRIVLTDTLTRQSTSLELHDVHPHQAAAPRISGDGKHVFWAVSDQLFHAKVENLEFQAPAAIKEIESCSYNFSVSYDGSRVFFRVMGPPINGRNPGWYAVRAADFDAQKWTVSDFLSPLVAGRDASHLGMTANGQFLYWSYEGTLMAASRSPQGTYKVESLPRDNAEHFAGGMSEDGATFLSIGSKRTAGGGHKSHSYVSYRGPSGFSEPRPVLPDHPLSIANAWLSSDGRTIIEHYLEYQQGSTLTAVGLRRVQVNPTTSQWQVTGDLARYPTTNQITEAYLSAAGGMAFTLYDHLVQPNKSEILFLPSFGPSVTVQNLSSR